MLAEGDSSRGTFGVVCAGLFAEADSQGTVDVRSQMRTSSHIIVPLVAKLQRLSQKSCSLGFGVSLDPLRSMRSSNLGNSRKPFFAALKQSSSFETASCTWQWHCLQSRALRGTGSGRGARRPSHREKCTI